MISITKDGTYRHDSGGRLYRAVDGLYPYSVTHSTITTVRAQCRHCEFGKIVLMIAIPNIE